MYYFFIVLNCLVILFIGYILVFAPDQLASGVQQWATTLAIRFLIGFLVLTGVSVYLRSARQMIGWSNLFMVLAWLLVPVCLVIFMGKQKWM
jgi:hypothetical protein